MRIIIIMIVLVMIIIEIIIMMIKKMIIIMIRCENENPLLSIQIFRKTWNKICYSWPTQVSANL